MFSSQDEIKSCTILVSMSNTFTNCKVQVHQLSTKFESHRTYSNYRKQFLEEKKSVFLTIEAN